MHGRSTSVVPALTVFMVCSGLVAAQQPGAAPLAHQPSRLAATPEVRLEAEHLLPGPRSNVMALVQGNALTATGALLTNASVRLRDARNGHIVDTTATDNAGLFVFRPVDPGTYVVELLGGDGTVLAASDLLAIEAGEVASVIVKLPWREAPFAGALGSSKGTAVLIVAAAAASGILATAVTNPPVSGER